MRREYQWRKAQFFHQKGWIANNFTVKNNVSAILKTRHKNHTEIARPESLQGATPIHHQPSSPFHRSSQFSRRSKPSSAPAKGRRERECVVEGGSGVGYWYDELLSGQMKNSNFKTTLNARKPLLFLRPYARNSSASTIDQRKAQIYQEINNPDLASFNLTFTQTGPIQYLTEYSQPTKIEGVKINKVGKQRKSLNVLREKLKRRCQPTYYQSKINMFQQA